MCELEHEQFMKPKDIFGLEPETAKTTVDTLTPREREVAEMLAFGKSNTVIAQNLGISRKTLDIHRSHIRQKLNTTAHGIGRVWFAAKFAGEK